MQQEAQQYLADITKITNSAIVWSGSLLKVLPYGDTVIGAGSLVSQTYQTWAIVLAGGNCLHGDSFTVTISDPALGTQSATYTVPGSGAFRMSTAAISTFLLNQIQSIVPSFRMSVSSVSVIDEGVGVYQITYTLQQQPASGGTSVSVSKSVAGSDSGTVFEVLNSTLTNPVGTGGVGTYTPDTTIVYDLRDWDFIIQASGVGGASGPTPGGDALKSGGSPITGGFGDDPLTITRSSPADADNAISIECLNRSNNYNSEVVEAQDQAAIQLYGLRKNTSLKAHAIPDPAIAWRVAQLTLQRAQLYRNTYSFRLGWRHCLLEPMDRVLISDVRMGLWQLPVRITAIEEDDEGTLTVSAEDYLGAVGAVLYPAAAAPIDSYVGAYTPPPAQPPPSTQGAGGGSLPVTPPPVPITLPGTGANDNVFPGNVNTPIFIEPPSSLITSGAAVEIWIALSGPTSNWGGAQVFVSSDGSSYAYLGQINGNANMGVTTASLAYYGGANPDNTDTLAVDLSESRGALASVSAQNAANLVSLCILGNGSGGELLAYQTATLTGSNAYNLTVLYRGAYGSLVQGQPSGTPFALIDGAVGRFPIMSGWVGKTLYFKFCSFNTAGGGLQSQAAVTPYTYTLTGGSQNPVSNPVISALAGGTNQDWGLTAASPVAGADFGYTSNPAALVIDLGIAA
jgi:hypothetical protein